MTTGLNKKQLLGRVQMNLKKKGLAITGAVALSASLLVSINSAQAAPASWNGPVPALSLIHI
mgnify:FL=1